MGVTVITYEPVCRHQPACTSPLGSTLKHQGHTRAEGQRDRHVGALVYEVELLRRPVTLRRYERKRLVERYHEELAAEPWVQRATDREKMRKVIRSILAREQIEADDVHLHRMGFARGEADRTTRERENVLHARGLGGIVGGILKGLPEHVAAHFHGAAEAVAVAGDLLQCHVDLSRHCVSPFVGAGSDDGGAPRYL